MKRVMVAVAVVFGLALAGMCAEAPVEKIDLTKDGVYNSAGWTYTVKITAKGTRSEGCVGTLACNGQPFAPDAKVNDWTATPWGKMYYMGEVHVPWGRHGWMPEPRANAPEGKQLGAPKIIVKDDLDLPAPKKEELRIALRVPNQVVGRLILRTVDREGAVLHRDRAVG